MRISFGTALSDEARSAVVPPPLCKLAGGADRLGGLRSYPSYGRFRCFGERFGSWRNVGIRPLLYRLPADYVTGRQEKPRRMSCNTARGKDRERCGPHARFWEARSYPAWVWRIGVVGAGLTLIVAYMALLRWV
jgi:hypothetical protein